jgi:hypothetical protein
MKTRITSFLFAALLAAAIPIVSSAQTTAFTYQGRLNQDGSPTTGFFDVRFALHSAPTGGSPLLNPITNSVVGVTNGLLTVPLDFGSDTFTGADRWLDIAVRPAGGGTFTALTPRQPITPTPYALTALNVPGISGSSLHSANNGPLNAVVVGNFGQVGVGTTDPQEKFDIRSGDESYVRVDSVNGDIRVNGGTDGQFGFFNDGPPTGGTHLIGEGQSRLFVANTGNVGIGTVGPEGKLDVRSGNGSYVRVDNENGDLKANGGSDGHFGIFNEGSVRGGTHLIGMGQSRLFVANTGNVGIGTTLPFEALEVRGNIRLGFQGELRAPGSEENLRIVRGRVGQAGQVVAGTGFQVAHQPIETPYTITFTPPFAAPPTVTATVEHSVLSGYIDTSFITANSVTLTVNVPGSGVRPSDFSFIAIGPR